MKDCNANRGANVHATHKVRMDSRGGSGVPGEAA